MQLKCAHDNYIVTSLRTEPAVYPLLGRVTETEVCEILKKVCGKNNLHSYSLQIFIHDVKVIPLFTIWSQTKTKLLCLRRLLIVSMVTYVAKHALQIAAEIWTLGKRFFYDCAHSLKKRKMLCQKHCKNAKQYFKTRNSSINSIFFNVLQSNNRPHVRFH